MSKSVEEVVQGSCRLPCLTGEQIPADDAARFVLRGSFGRSGRVVDSITQARESVHENSLSCPTQYSSTQALGAPPAAHFRFITAIPQNVCAGSGCFVGIRTLTQGLRELGVEIELVTPKLHLVPYTASRILFNHTLGRSAFQGDATVGFDLDGYHLAGKGTAPHIAAIKGVLGDAVRFEKGFTRASMALQARLEMLHARRADRVITVSRYCADRIGELYGVRNVIVVPELIDLAAWRKLLAANPPPMATGRFTVLCVCRFYPRKRVELLLRAAALLTRRIPELEVRIVGGGPDALRLHRLAQELHLQRTVHWVGNATADSLACEYNRADVFCLPSVQEGFGIVFLEAMAAGKPIIAARAAAVPEVVELGLLVEPENSEAIADAITVIYGNSGLRNHLAASGQVLVRRYEMKRVAARFLRACLESSAHKEHSHEPQ